MSSPTRLRGFNICRRARPNRTDACWRGYRDRGAFPGSNGLNYDFDSGQRAFDFILHARNLRL
jgi:hypothetical protein